MKIVNFKLLNNKEKHLIDLAFSIAAKTLSRSGDRIGSAIIDSENNYFVGAAIARMRVNNSTCAERMALDNLLLNKNSNPKMISIVGKINGKKKDFCTPCGSCRQIFQEISQIKKLKNIIFLICDWKKNTVLKISLSELLPFPFNGEVIRYK